MRGAFPARREPCGREFSIVAAGGAAQRYAAIVVLLTRLQRGAAHFGGA
jgi:hypothetical protein